MSTPKLILLVDDDLDYLEIGRLALEAAGYRVVCSPDTDQALARVEEELPALIVSDLMMRSLQEGFAFARRLKADPRTATIPIILTTGIKRQLGGITFNPRSAEELAKMGVDAYLEKPVRGNVLVAKAREILG